MTLSLAAQEKTKNSEADAARNARAQATPQTGTQLPTIPVQGRRPQPAQRPAAARVERGTGPVNGYTAQQSASSTKTDTPVLETPQSISIVPKDQIVAQQSQTISQALRYTPSVMLDLYSVNSLFDSVKLRGFPAMQYLDGLRLPLDPNTQFAMPRIEPYGLERIEVLKGPSSGLYGQTDPGGFINMISKRPLGYRHTEFVGQFGSFDRYQGAFDIGGVSGANNQYQFRLVGLARDSNSQLNFQQDNKFFIAPTFKWQITPDTSFTLISHYQKIDNKGYQQYVPGPGSAFFNPNGRIPYSRYLGEPGVDGYRLEQSAIGYAFEHRFNDIFQFRQNFRYTTVKNDLTGVRVDGLLADQRTGVRSVNYVMSDSHNIAVDNHVQADFTTGALKHKVLVGLDYLNIKSNSDYRFAAVAPIDVFNPVYGTPVTPASALAPFIAAENKQRQTGVYIQDQIKLDRWTLTLTGRHDWATAETLSTGFFPPAGVTNQNDTAFTGRAGLNYLFPFGLAPYVTYSTSFLPTAGTDISGNAFKPTTGNNKEIGIKYQPPGSNLLFTTAFFETTQRNVLTADPNNLFFSVQTGEARVRGFEFEVRGNLSRELEIIGGYSRLDPRVTQSNDGFTGKYMVNVALEQASLWGMYTLYNGRFAGLGFGAGVRYVGESYVDGANTLHVPPYTLVDAAIKYDLAYLDPQLKGWKAQINASNLFDRYYVANCFTSSIYCGLGASRTVLLTLKYSWNEEPRAKRVR